MSGFVIKELFAFTTVDPKDGDEGVLGFHGGEGWMPMVGADMTRVDQLKPIADRVSKELGLSYRIKRFTYVDDLT